MFKIVLFNTNYFSRVTCDSYGEPHITTFDRASIYNDQLGDYVLFSTLDNRIVVVERHLPCYPDELSGSCIRGMAVRVNGISLEFVITVGDSLTTVDFVDNGQVILTNSSAPWDTVSHTLAAGGTVKGSGEIFHVNITDAAGLAYPFVIDLHAYMRGGSILIRTNSANFPEGTVGLCGDLDGRRDNDEALIASWGTTLLVSGSKRRQAITTNPFSANPTLPTSWNPLTGLTAVPFTKISESAAQAACAALTGENFDNCVLDVGITGDTSFASYATDHLSDACSITCDPTVSLIVPPPAKYDYTVCNCPERRPSSVYNTLRVTGPTGKILDQACVKHQIELVGSTTADQVAVTGLTETDWDITFHTTSYMSQAVADTIDVSTCWVNAPPPWNAASGGSSSSSFASHLGVF